MSDNNNNGGNGKVDNFSKLEQLLGFNPSKRPTVTGNILAEVQKEILEARTVKAKEMAKKVIEEAMLIHEQAIKAKQQADQMWAKHNKELGKLVATLEAATKGIEPPTESEEQPPSA